jgi:murein L,D-transpeptidase YcbB/YkuD
MRFIYDTPAKSLFNREDRAFSHGCIRVEKPVELATQILKNDKMG